MKTTDLSYLKAKGTTLTDDCAMLVTKTLLNSDIQLKGEEMAFIRNSMKLSYDKMSKIIGVNASTIMRWEEAKEKPLSQINAMAVRTTCSKKLGIDIQNQNPYFCKTPKALSLDSKKKEVVVIY